jgi:hypothetical protein
MSEEKKAKLLRMVKGNLRKIEGLCARCDMTPEQLPAPSRAAYEYLKRFDGTEITVGEDTCELKAPFNDGIDALFRNIYEDIFKAPSPRIVVQYYPYSTIKATIRREDGTVYARLSDVLGEAPADIKKVIGTILLCKLMRAECPREAVLAYKGYLNSPEIMNQYNELRRTRGAKILLGPKGRFHNLEDSFHRVNRQYFCGDMPKPQLTWSVKRTRARLGHEDAAMNTVVISRSLDRFEVPEYVLDYVMYHELLHIRHGSKYKDGRTRIHTREFRADERKCAQWREAECWLERNRV